MNFEGVSLAIMRRLAGYTSWPTVPSYVGVDKPQDAQAEAVANFPYVVLEEVAARPWDTKTSDGGEVLFQVTAFCRPNGSMSAHAMANAMAQAAYDALHKFELTIGGSVCVNCLFEESPGVMRDPDGSTRYRPMTFRVVYQ